MYRMLDVMGNRIVDIFSPDKLVSDMVSQKVYRIEVSLTLVDDNDFLSLLLSAL